MSGHPFSFMPHCSLAFCFQPLRIKLPSGQQVALIFLDTEGSPLPSKHGYSQLLILNLALSKPKLISPQFILICNAFGRFVYSHLPFIILLFHFFFWDLVSVYFFITTGFAATNVSESYDAKVFAVATLLSSYLIYNSVKVSTKNPGLVNHQRYKTLRKHAFLPCGHLDFQSAVLLTRIQAKIK